MGQAWKIALLAALLVVVALLVRSELPLAGLRHTDRSKLPPSSLPIQSPISDERLVVIHKAERVLGLYLRGRLIEAYPIGLGRHPEGPKEARGDGRTPEGVYYICTRNARSQFHLFLGISYPKKDDADRAIRAGRISAEEHRTIVEAINAGPQPPWDTALGGEIGIHGGGAERDWTLGCIALENDAVERLWDTLKIGDPVLIEP
jgi:murein L,D-transpeptidase YafK